MLNVWFLGWCFLFLWVGEVILVDYVLLYVVWVVLVGYYCVWVLWGVGFFFVGVGF